ncbi:sialate:O-sulfotransferase 1-like [Lytechinus pictus]|uniref:sialate:O-sulfotransferase 1-like n=1 Tax=Lytechinus pictus TaxID=7653 RepID=UPI0030B9F611
MDYIWSKERAIFFVLFIGLIIFTFFIIKDDLQTNIRDTHTIGNTIQHTTGSNQKGAIIESCDDTRLMPKNTFPTIALASYQGSGNTWVRHLIETSTGFATGSIYHSRTLINQGFIGEKEDHLIGTTLTVKTHNMARGNMTSHMVGAILLVRNPYRALVSEFNRRKAGKTGHAPIYKFQTEEWHRYVRRFSRSWIGLPEHLISSCHSPRNVCKSMIIVYYEQLKLHIADEMRRILDYLNVSIDEERLACTIANAEGKFHRQTSNTSLDPFTQEERTMIDGYVKSYLDLIDMWDLQKPPTSVISYPTDLHL